MKYYSRILPSYSSVRRRKITGGAKILHAHTRAAAASIIIFIMVRITHFIKFVKHIKKHWIMLSRFFKPSQGYIGSRSASILSNPIDLETIDVDLFRSKSLWKPIGARAVFGGQVLPFLHGICFLYAK